MLKLYQAVLLSSCPRVSRCTLRTNPAGLYVLDVARICTADVHAKALACDQPAPLYEDTSLHVRDCWTTPNSDKRVKDKAEACSNILNARPPKTQPLHDTCESRDPAQDSPCKILPGPVGVEPHAFLGSLPTLQECAGHLMSLLSHLLQLLFRLVELQRASMPTPALCRP